MLSSVCDFQRMQQWSELLMTSVKIIIPDMKECEHQGIFQAKPDFNQMDCSTVSIDLSAVIAGYFWSTRRH